MVAWETMLTEYLSQAMLLANYWWTDYHDPDLVDRFSPLSFRHDMPRGRLDPARAPIQEYIVLAAEDILTRLVQGSQVSAEARVNEVADNNRERFDGAIAAALGDAIALAHSELESLRLALARFTIRVPTAALWLVGYGATAMYPSTVEIGVYGLDGSKLQARLLRRRNVLHSNDASILGIGQAHEIDAFISGIHPDAIPSWAEEEGEPIIGLRDWILDLLRSTAVADPNTDEIVRGILPEISTEFERVDAAWHRRWDDQSNKLRRETLEGLAFLSKSALAEAAETLISQAILRRTLTVDAEPSIGGHVEVATISRESGVDLRNSPRVARVPVH
jgi:hypothetical protein